MAVRLLKRSDWAEEVLQESFVSVWRHAARYDRTRGAPMTWLIRIVRNQSFDWIHPSQADGHERLHGVSIDWWEDCGLGEAHQLGDIDALESLDAARQADRVTRCLGELDARQRQSISLVFFHGLSHGELAKHLQQPLGTVKAWVRRGLKRLRSCLTTKA